MKINPHDPAYPLGHGMGGRADGLPIRLELAARFMGEANAFRDPEIFAEMALDWADKLIAAYNEGQE